MVEISYLLLFYTIFKHSFKKKNITPYLNTTEILKKQTVNPEKLDCDTFRFIDEICIRTSIETITHYRYQII